MNLEKQFALICYLVLMQTLSSKSPDYILEKYKMLEMGYSAIQRLHPTLHDYVIQYYEKWNLKFPEQAKKFIN